MQTETNNAPSRILVVDDNAMNRDMLTRRLVKNGYVVEEAANGKTALEMVAASEFDLVMLDIKMPEMDGYEVLERIKADEALRHVPVVMISAMEDTDSVVRCLELGADDYLPKPFSPAILRARVTASLDRKRLRDRERIYAMNMERELEIGRQIQVGFLPDALPSTEGWEMAARFEPARKVGGDFYDAFRLRNGAVACVVADVCDKGVGAALYMALFRSLLRAVATEHPAHASSEAVLAEAVRVTNDYIATTHDRSNMFATVFFGVVEPSDGTLLYVNGGHEAPMILTGGAVRARLAPTGPALGMFPDTRFAIGREVLAPGETLLVFTDGVTEAKGESGFLGEERLAEIAGQAGPSADALLDLVHRATHEHAGVHERSDDITLLALRRV